MAALTASQQPAADRRRSEPEPPAPGAPTIAPDDARSRAGAREKRPEDDNLRALRRLRVLLGAGAVVLALGVVPGIAGNALLGGAVALVGILLIWLALWRRSRFILSMRAARDRREALLEPFAHASLPIPACVVAGPWQAPVTAPATVEDVARLAALQTRGERDAPRVAGAVREQLDRLRSGDPALARAAYEAAVARCDARRARMESWLLGDPQAIQAATDDRVGCATALVAALELLLDGARADLAAGPDDTPALRQLLAFDAALADPAGADDEMALALCSEVCRLLEVPLQPDRHAYEAFYVRQQQQDPVTLDLSDADLGRLVRVLAVGARERGGSTERGWSRYPWLTQHIGAEIGAWHDHGEGASATLGAAARRHLGALVEAHIAAADRLLEGGNPVLGSMRPELTEARARDLALLTRLRLPPAP